MSKTGRIIGTVTEKKGVAGAMVVVQGTSLVAVTDMDGAYTLADVPEGPQTIQASDVLAKENKKVEVIAGETITVDFHINPLRPS